MSTTTTNYSLIKPALTDPADITATNANWDKIDAELKKKVELSTDGKIPASQLPSMDYIPNSEKGVASGVATLGTDGKVPASQLNIAAPTGAASTIQTDNLTANRALISNASGKVAVSPVTSTELGYLDGVTSAVQTQIDNKANSTHTHSATDINSGTLPITRGGTGATTAAGVLTNLGVTATAAELNKMDGVTATTTELNYVDGVTSNIQTQLNNKLSTSGGSVTAPINFTNSNETRAISKIRTVESTGYFMDVGIGAYGGKGTAYMRILQGSDSTGTQLYRMDITPNGVLLQNTAGNVFWLGQSGAVTASVES